MFRCLWVLIALIVIGSSCAKQLQTHGSIPDCCCDTATVDTQNSEHIHDLLQNIRERTFFKIFKVNLNGECPFWEDNPVCSLKSCSVFGCPDEQVPESWKMERTNPVDRTLAQPFQEWSEKDNFWIHQDDDSSQMTYINLQLNKEGYTGYEGHDAHRVWQAIYETNCFHGKFSVDQMCFEERVFYRLISGLHAEIAAHSSERYVVRNDDSVQPNLAVFESKIGQYPERIENIYFVFVFLSRAIKKAAQVLRAFNYSTGNSLEDAETTILIEKMISSNVVQSCSPENSFDESSMFRDPLMQPLLSDFRNHFRNISRIIDCVGCEKCRLHGKLQVLGLGTALKIMFSASAQKIKLERNEIIALINTFGKFSHAIQIVQSMQATRHRRIWLKRIVVGCMITFVLFVFTVVVRKRRQRQAQLASEFEAATSSSFRSDDDSDSDPKKIS